MRDAEGEGALWLAPPPATASADNAAIVVGSVLALLLSSVEACPPERLADSLETQAALLKQLTPWLTCAPPRPYAPHCCNFERD